MNKHCFTRTIGMAACMAVLMSGAARADIGGFTAIEITGRCQAKAPGQAEFAPVVKGQEYDFGTMVTTSRNSALVLEFSTGNTFQLLARTKLIIAEDTRDPKLKILKLREGTVNLTLDDFPKDHKLQVETPTAVCGAVGTRFVVSFDDDDASKAKNSFSCDKGEVFVASRFEFDDDQPVLRRTLDVPSVKAGSALVAVIHQGLENSYTDVTVNRGKLTFDYGGKAGKLRVSPDEGKSARFICSLEKSEGDVDMMALKVEDGEVENVRTTRRFGFGAEKEEIDTVSDGATVVIQKSEVKEPKKAEDMGAVEAYLDAAREEGEAHTEWVEMKLDDAPKAAIDAQEVKVKTAAAKASKLRRQLMAKRMRKLTGQIRRAANRSQMHRRIRH